MWNSLGAHSEWIELVGKQALFTNSQFSEIRNNYVFGYEEKQNLNLFKVFRQTFD